MLLAETQVVDSFSYEGALDWGQAVWLMLSLTAFVGWLLWRERGVTGVRAAGLFFLLRVAAIALVLWMLLGPSHVQVERTTIPQTIAIVTDVSQSMHVAEPLPPLEALRWRQALDPQETGHPELAALDAALVDLRFASLHTAAARDAGVQFAPAAEVSTELAVAEKALERGRQNLQHAADGLADSDRTATAAARQLARQLSAEGLPSVHRVLATWKRDTEDTDGARRQATESFTEDCQRWLRECETIVRRVGVQVAPEALATADPLAGVSRGELTRRMLDRLEEQTLSKIGRTTNLKRLVFERTVTPVAAADGWAGAAQTADQDQRDPAEAYTNLTAALELLRQDAAGESIVAAFLTSDGGHNAPNATAPAAYAAGIGLPVYALPLGASVVQRDLAIHRVNAPSTVAKGDSIVIDAIVSGAHLVGERVTVELREGDDLVDRKQVAFDSQRQDHRLQFTVKADDLGQRNFDLVADVLEEESNDKNNASVVSVRVVQDTIRLLLADHTARWEFRYLDQLWRRAKRVQFDRLSWAPNRSATGGIAATRELPRDVDAWAEYDVVILGDLDPENFDQQQQDSLQEWVRDRGGHAIVIAGKQHLPHAYPAGPLTDLLPVQRTQWDVSSQEGYIPRRTGEGSRNEALMLEDSLAESGELWAAQYRNTPIYYVSSYCRPKPSAHVLLEVSGVRQAWIPEDDPDPNDAPALLAWHDVGAGRVVYLSSPFSWRLRYLQGDTLHHRFWGQLLRWLTAAERGAGDSQLFVRVSGAKFNLGEVVEVAVTAANPDGTPVPGAQLTAEAVSATGDPIGVALQPDPNSPGRYLGRFEGLPAGAYRIAVSGDFVDQLLDEDPEALDETPVVLIAAPDNLEMADTRGDRNLLKEIAAVTAGQVLPPTAVGEALELSAAAPRVIEKSSSTPLWNRWSYLWIVVGCLATEWTIRRLIGLV